MVGEFVTDVTGLNLVTSRDQQYGEVSFVQYKQADKVGTRTK